MKNFVAGTVEGNIKSFENHWFFSWKGNAWYTVLNFHISVGVWSRSLRPKFFPAFHFRHFYGYFKEWCFWSFDWKRPVVILQIIIQSCGSWIPCRSRFTMLTTGKRLHFKSRHFRIHAQITEYRPRREWNGIYYFWSAPLAGKKNQIYLLLSVGDSGALG